MARKKLSLRPSTKTAKPRGSVSKQTETLAFHGLEPDRGTGSYQLYLMKFYNWANAMWDFPTLKDMFMEHAKAQGYKVSVINGLSPFNFGAIGKLVHLLKTDETNEYLIEKYDEELFKLIEIVAVEEANKVVEPINDERQIDKTLVEYWDLYSKVDDFIHRGVMENDTLTKIFTEERPNLKALKLLQTHYKENLVFLVKPTGTKKYKDIINKTYSQTSEAVRQIDACLINLENTKAAVRKPRKTSSNKIKPAIKLVEKLQYKKADTTLGLTSIAPESIIGAKSLLIFNTKTRKFGTFYSNIDTGLSVKGTTIIGFDEDKSINKTLRKPTEQISMLTGSTIRRMENLFKDIRAVGTKMKGRISEDILLLKVFK